jgi:hypothetical protein
MRAGLTYLGRSSITFSAQRGFAGYLLGDCKDGAISTRIRYQYQTHPCVSRSCFHDRALI